MTSISYFLLDEVEFKRYKIKHLKNFLFFFFLTVRETLTRLRHSAGRNEHTNVSFCC